MDALIYTVMSGAERVLRAQQVHANNLANVETAGFRANIEQSTAQQVEGHGYAARHLNQLSSDTVSGKEGTQRETGRELDVAVQGQGLFAIQFGQNGEAYTRGGNFTLDAEGNLLLGKHPVLGEGGPINLPPHSKVEITADGVISVQTPGAQELQAVDRLKLVKPEFAQLRKNELGLLVARDGQALAADATVKVGSGRLESSNVSAVEEMVATMSLARDFEIQMKLFKSADGMADAGNRLIRE
ncbi:flagellar basal body rod protein FlgF [Roseateles sp. DAIF2]|uniref:flagellar basal body rod protein FlgF n=1 Tax=Roseateles sp. DAIF2 TaxID=2714952 RepID=UPI0018A2C764|nr:flagellar basal body rod protein FlgF [Roseateles sp. DAIF2]QPF74150.1 flagellar basal body rod protein FlgF [Roseateles sp. DAIF2]